MATAAMGWLDYAILEPSKPAFNKKGEPVKWKVQRNAAGEWRCHCPGYIFSGKGGAVRQCKHTRFCQAQWQVEQMGSVPMSTLKSHLPMPKATTVPVVADVAAPLLAEAKTIFAAMVAAAQIKVKHNILDHIGRESCQHMTEALRQRLATFNPAAAAMDAKVAASKFAPVPVVGIRHITFTDDD